MSDLDLARRAVAAKGWRWMEGAKDTEGGRVSAARSRPPESRDGCGFAEVVGDSVYACDGYQSCPLCEPENYREMLPDLNDPATLGCVEALVREAWGEDFHLSPEWDVERGVVVAWNASAMAMYAHGWVRVVDLPQGPTRAHALLAALEAAKAAG